MKPENHKTAQLMHSYSIYHSVHEYNRLVHGMKMKQKVSSYVKQQINLHTTLGFCGYKHATY